MNGTGAQAGLEPLDWRSILFVPADRERFVAKAQSRGADAILLDLEDAVEDDRKDAARAGLARAVGQLRGGPAAIGVRINRPLSLAVRDIAAAVRTGASILSLPKTECGEHVRLLAEVVDEAEETSGSVRFIVNIESAAALLRAQDIATAHPRVAALVVGPEDLSHSLGCEPTPDALQLPRQMGMIAARAAGILPIGLIGSNTDFGDVEAFRQMVCASRRMGFACGSAIHPAQVPVVNKAFSPTAQEVAAARDILAAASGRRGAFSFEGKMIDKPVLQRAEWQLRRHARYRAGRAHHPVSG